MHTLKSTGGVVALGVALSGCVVVSSPDSFGDRSEVFPDSMTSLVLEAPAGDIDVRVGSQPGFDASLAWSGDNEPILEVTRQGNRSVYAWKCRRASQFCTIDMVVDVPATLADLEIDLDAGNVSTFDLVGGLLLGVDAGDVEIDGHDGPVDLSVDAGNVTATGLASATVRTEVDTGNLDLAFDVRPREVIAEADVGNIDIAVPSGSYRLRTSVDVGRVDIDGVTHDGGADAVIEAEIDTGNISIRGR